MNTSLLLLGSTQRYVREESTGVLHLRSTLRCVDFSTVVRPTISATGNVGRESENSPPKWTREKL